MKTYIKPETIEADMLTQENLVQASMKTGTSLKNEYVSGDSYAKEDKCWDDWDE